MKRIFSFVVLLMALSCGDEDPKQVSFSITSFSPTEGFPGTTVTITGINFDPGTSVPTVVIGDAIARINSVTATEINVTVPITATTDFISVTIKGETATSEEQFSVLQPGVASVTPTSGRIGSYITLSGTGFDKNTVVKFGTQIATIVTYDSTSMMVAVPPTPATATDLHVIFDGNSPAQANDKVALPNFSVKHDTWISKGNLPGIKNRRNPVWFAIGSKIYYGLGRGDGGNDLIKDLLDVWEFSPETGEWVAKNEFRTNALGGGTYYETLIEASTLVIDNKAYVIDPYAVWEYDPTTDLWTKKKTFKGFLRDGSVSFVIGSRGYYGTGVNGGYKSPDFWEYDPSVDSWTRKKDYAGGGRSYGIGFSIGGKGYLGGGVDSTDSSAVFYEYDPTQDSWLKKPDCPASNIYGQINIYRARFSIGNFGYCGDVNRSFYRYDATAARWIQIEDIPQSTTGDQNYWAVTIGNKAYVRNSTEFWEMNVD